MNLNDELMIRAKAFAAQRRTSLTRLIEEGLQLRLKEPEKTEAGMGPVKLPIHRGRGGLASGLDGLSNKALLDAADGDP